MVPAFYTLFCGNGGGETSDDWQPPADWLTVPEPGEMEICLLICTVSTKKFGVSLADFETGNSGGRGLQCGIKVDWGDGTTDDGTQLNQWETYDNYFSHTYAESRQYIVKVTGNVNANAWLWNNDTTKIIQIAKIGSGIHLWTKTQPASSNIWGSQSYLKWIKVLNSGGLYDESYDGIINSQAIFSGCNSLKKIEIPSRLKKINVDDIFNNCYGLTNFDFSDVSEISAQRVFQRSGLQKLSLPKCTAITGYNAFSQCQSLNGKIELPACTSIGNDVFNNCYNITEIYAPNCKSVGSRTFAYCYNLQKVTFADGCTFGSGAFDYCYSLYPIPT